MKPDWTVYSARGASLSVGQAVGTMLRDLWHSRELAWALFTRDFSARYRQSLLGWTWAAVPAVLVALTATLAGGAGFLRVDSGGVPYPVLALVGSVLWMSFSEAVQAPIIALSESKPLITRVRLPAEALVLSKVWDVLLGQAIRAVTVGIALAWYGVGPADGAALAVGLAGLAILTVLGLGIGLVLAPVAGLYDDIGKGLPPLLGVMMLLTPVLYRTPGEGSMVERINRFNPMAVPLGLARDALVGLPPESSTAGLWLSAVLGVLAVLAGWSLLRFALPLVIERAG